MWEPSGQSESELENTIAAELNSAEDVLRQMSSDPLRDHDWRDKRSEISQVLAKHSSIREAAVVIREVGTGIKRIAVFAVPHRRYSPTLDGRPRLVLPNGLAVLCPNQGDTAESYSRIFEDRIHLRHGIVIADGDTVVDIRSGTGLFALFVRRTFPSTVVYAAEPDLVAEECLRANLAIYEPSVRVLPAPNGASDDAWIEFINANDIRSIDLLKWDLDTTERDPFPKFVAAEWRSVRQFVLRLRSRDAACEYQRLLTEQGCETSVDIIEPYGGQSFSYVYAKRQSADRSDDASGRPDFAAPENFLAVDDRIVSRAEVRTYIADRVSLPCAMDIALLESLPRMSDGAVDEGSLLTVDEGSQLRIEPQTATETKVFQIWAELLAFGEFGVEDDFFELGGHSLLAIQVISRIRENFGIELPLSLMFGDVLTVASVAQTIERALIDQAPHELS